MLPYFTMFQKTIYEFPVKKEPDPHSGNLDPLRVAAEAGARLSIPFGFN